MEDNTMREFLKWVGITAMWLIVLAFSVKVLVWAISS
jgi:hypothetical protein